MSEAVERVYQAEPSICVSEARDALDEALRLLGEEAPDLDAIRERVRRARFWLPSWLIDSWDAEMAAWIARENAS